MFSKKGIGPVIASGLLLVVAIVSIVGFQTWFNNYSSVTFANVETQSGDSVGSTNIDTISNNYLYFKNSNSDNISIQSVKVSGVDCSISQEVSSGLTGINITSCLSNLTSRNVDVVVITNDKVYSKKVYLADVNLGTSSVSSFLSFSSNVTILNDTGPYLNGTVLLTWSTTAMTSCSASGNWSGVKATSGTEIISNISTTSVFNISCNGDSGSLNDSITVTVVDRYFDDFVIADYAVTTISNGYMGISDEHVLPVNGTVTSVLVYSGNSATPTNVIFSVWRVNGSNYDRIGYSEVIASVSLSVGLNQINLSTPIEGVLAGDVLGFLFFGTDGALVSNDADLTSGAMIFYDSTHFDITSKIPNLSVPIVISDGGGAYYRPAYITSLGAIII